MPAYPDMTLAQLVDLVAYLKTLGAPEAGHAHDEGATEKVVGGYRVRLAYAAAESHHHDARGGGMMMMDMPGRLQVFLTEATSGQPIPYTPVTARIATSGKPARTVTLAPSLGDRGFFYGADVTLPDKTTRITLSIGPSTMKLGPGAPEGLKRTQTVSFDWK
jgi:hypothetical protein